MPTRGPLSPFTAPIASIPFLLARPRLLALAILPALINLLVFLLLFWLLNNHVIGVWRVEEILGVGWIDAVLVPIARFLLFVVALLISGFVAYLLLIPISAPFCDLISENIEEELLRGRPHLRAAPQSILTSIGHSVRDAFTRVLFVTPIALLLFACSLIPVIGIFFAAMAFLNNALFLSFDAYSYSFDRRLMRFRSKWRWLRERREIWLPLGLGLAVLVLIPCNVIFVPTLSAVSGTRLFCQRLLEEDSAREAIPASAVTALPPPGTNATPR